MYINTHMHAYILKKQIEGYVYTYVYILIWTVQSVVMYQKCSSVKVTYFKETSNDICY